MPIPDSRDEFKEYCLRALGKPVIQVNVEDEQVEDRIDEAVYVYQQHHYDAVVQTYMQHRITASTMVFDAPISGTFRDREAILGATTHTTGICYETINSTAILFVTSRSNEDSIPATDVLSDTARASFQVGEVITGGLSGASGTIASITFGDIDNRWFHVADSVIGITKVFVPYDSGLSGDLLFDAQAQFNVALLSNFAVNSIVPYVIGRQYQQLMNDTFRGRPAVRFKRHMNRLYVDINWNTTFRPGQVVIVDGFRVIDPDTYTDVWSDRWLQRYATALIKRQWGQNLSKYNGIALPGGVHLDGKSMFMEAAQEIKDLEIELQDRYTEPPMFIVG